MLNMRLILLVISLFSFQYASAANHVVLIPGFFNSVVPAPQADGDPWQQPYFSQDIVRSLQKNQDTVWVVDNLNPVGGVKENGERLIRFLNRHLTNMSQVEKSKQLVLIGHSAGGLYALYAAANSDLPIDRIITVSTPYQGLQFLETMANAHIPLEKLAAPFCLTNLLGLRKEPVQNFLSQLKLRHPLRLDVFAGYQPLGLWTWDFRFLSAALVVFQSLTKQASDGIVTINSSLGASSLLANNPFLQLNIHHEFVDLEHWEMAADSQIFWLTGVLNTEDLRATQSQTYPQLLRATGL